MNEVRANEALPSGEVPLGNAAGFINYLRNDLISGLLVS